MEAQVNESLMLQKFSRQILMKLSVFCPRDGLENQRDRATIERYEIVEFWQHLDETLASYNSMCMYKRFSNVMWLSKSYFCVFSGAQ